MLEFLILGALTIHAMSGYEIKKLMSKSTSFFSNVSDGSIYPTLKRAEESGLVRSREMVENGRYKKVYEITAEGRQVFLDWMEEPLKPFAFRYEMLIRIFFARNLPPEKLTLLVDQHLSQLNELAQSLEQIEQETVGNIDPFQKFTLSFGRDFYDFLIKWYNQLKTDVEGSEQESPRCLIKFEEE